MKKWIKIFTFAYGQGPPYSQPDRRMSVLGGRQNLLTGFFPLRGYQKPAHLLLNGKSFCPKTLSGNGGYSPLAEKIDLTHIGLEIVKY